jgi:hypothetical protein
MSTSVTENVFRIFVSDLRSGFQVLIPAFVSQRPRRSKFNIYMINFNTKTRTLSRCSAMAWSTRGSSSANAVRLFKEILYGSAGQLQVTNTQATGGSSKSGLSAASRLLINHTGLPSMPARCPALPLINPSRSLPDGASIPFRHHPLALDFNFRDFALPLHCSTNTLCLIYILCT